MFLKISINEIERLKDRFVVRYPRFLQCDDLYAMDGN
mgnify:CR=1 FL=1